MALDSPTTPSGAAIASPASSVAVLSTPERANERRRAMFSVFAGAGLSSTGYIAAVTVAPLIAEDLLGSSTWGGIPSATSVLGTALGTSLLSVVMSRHGRRAGLQIGYLVGALASIAIVVGVTTGRFWVVLVGMGLLGLGNAANRLARYVGAELYPAEQRGQAISWIVAAGTVGSVLGPILLGPARSAAIRLDLAGSAGAFLVTVVAFTGAAGMVLGLPRGHITPPEPGRAAGGLGSLAAFGGNPGVRLAVTAMIVGQSVMVLLMTMTPIHIHHAGAGLGSVGLVIGAHTMGMYGLSPITGRLSDRVGRLPMIAAGTGLLLVSALLASRAEGANIGLLVIALFLLGLGWNFGFVAGSALLADSVTRGDRVRLEGASDSLVWITGAVAMVISGVLMTAWGYGVLSLIGAVAALLPVRDLVRVRRLAPHLR